jgi:hypothetical protein
MANNSIFQFNGFDSMAYLFINMKKNIMPPPPPQKKKELPLKHQDKISPVNKD